jgi:putative spermidine/putrescine transport system substrate-binding protein
MTHSAIRPVFVLLAFVLLLFSGCQENQTEEDSAATLTVASFGGSYQEAQRKAYFDPFAEERGIQIVEHSYEGDLHQIIDAVESDNSDWDVVSVESTAVPQGAELGLYEPIDYTIVPRDALPSEAVDTFGVAGCFWSTVLSYSTGHYTPTVPHPANWKEFWDVEAFPGPRSLRENPIGNIEFALLADGVTVDDLYPPDLDRAFKMLDQIKNGISVWWETGEQPAQMLAHGEAVLASAWSGRIYNAREAGEAVDIEWNQGMLNSDWWVVPKSSKNKKLAMEFIAFALDPNAQAAFTRYIPYSPSNPAAEKLIPADRLKDLPGSDANRSKQFLVNTKWWAENQDEVMTRWNEWLHK